MQCQKYSAKRDLMHWMIDSLSQKKVGLPDHFILSLDHQSGLSHRELFKSGYLQLLKRRRLVSV